MSENNIQEEQFLSKMGAGENTLEALRQAGRRYRQRENIGCPDCDFTGHLVNDEDQGILCHCAKQKMREKRFEEACIPSAYWNMGMSDWSVQQDSHGRDLGSQSKLSNNVRVLITHYCDNLLNICTGHPPSIKHAGGIRTKLHSLKLEGNNGSGKTFLASVILQEAIKRGLSAYYADWANLAAIMRSFEKEAEQDQMYEVFRNYDVVVIDGIEPFDGKLTGPCIMQVDRICRARINSGKPTILGVSAGWERMDAGSGIKSLADKCLRIPLPNTDTAYKSTAF